ncbi:MAG: GNAT family N-acetyltransferase [Chloroflexi bacterium]|nr:GNAT family N-acetyltransferase [Chloroflexota bacterium]
MMSNNQTFTLSTAPPIPGLTFRHFRGATDHAGMAAVHENSRVWDQVDPRSAREGVPTSADLAATFPEAEMGENADLLIVAIDEEVIGYNHVRWRWTEVTGVRVYLHLGYLLPAWRGKGIGQAMLTWAQGRIRVLAASEEGDAHATFATNVSSTEIEADALIRHADYVAVRRLSDMVLELTLPIETRPLPVGVNLRPVEPDQYPAIYQAWKDAFSVNWTSRPASEADYQIFLSDNVKGEHCDPSLWQIAWVDDQVVGLVFAQVNREIGVFPEVAVRQAWQRRGIARTLMLGALAEFQQRGIHHIRLFTDADNGQGARSLYESLGFREIKQHILYRKPLKP